MADAAAGGTVLVAHPGTELYGSDRVMLETLAAMVEHGRRVVLAVPSSGPLVDEAVRLGAEIVLLPVPVVRKNLRHPRKLAAFLLGSLGAARRIRALLRRVRPDLVYVSTLTVPLWIAVSHAHGVRVLAHVHESERQAPRLLRLLIAAPLRLADRVVVNSAFSLDSLLDVVPQLTATSDVVYNGVRGPESVIPPREHLDGALRVIYVGRLSPRKGVDVAVDAVGLLLRSGVDVELDVVGSVFEGYEWYLQDLRDRVALHGLQQRVRFRGFHPAVWAALADADVVVVPSRLEEPFGNTAVEAMLAARPVVVSGIGGLAEAVDGFSSAVVVAPGDPRALADALLQIREQWPAYRRSAHLAAPVAAQRFSPYGYRRAISAEVDRLLPPARLTPVA